MAGYTELGESPRIAPDPRGNSSWERRFQQAERISTCATCLALWEMPSIKCRQPLQIRLLGTQRLQGREPFQMESGSNAWNALLTTHCRRIKCRSLKVAKCWRGRLPLRRLNVSHLTFVRPLVFHLMRLRSEIVSHFKSSLLRHPKCYPPKPRMPQYEYGGSWGAFGWRRVPSWIAYRINRNSDWQVKRHRWIHL